MRWIIVVAFSLAVGHLAWNGFLGPTPVPEYSVGGRSWPFPARIPVRRAST